MAVLWAPITRSPGVMSLIMADRGTPKWGTPEKPTENSYIKVIFGVAFSMLLVPRMEIAIPNPVVGRRNYSACRFSTLRRQAYQLNPLNRDIDGVFGSERRAEGA
jgi:hypothetical protein